MKKFTYTLAFTAPYHFAQTSNALEVVNIEVEDNVFASLEAGIPDVPDPTVLAET